uniref:Uncharacterized protein n=1 Tax=Poecilia mexicana TaxID=48701 RepID=A0A3B3XRH8_9TELE
MNWQLSRLLLSTAMAGGSSGCQQSGCLTCSDYNGCLSCKPRLFMHLERIGMKQIGVCMTSCPPGFYGTRSPERNTCTKCRSECDSCFNKNFCTRCRAGFYLHLGKCLDSCPVGMVHSDCESCVNMHCEVGEWSEWSPCSRSGRTCGFRRGQETRTRQVQQYPSPFGNPCPEISEVKECLKRRNSIIKVIYASKHQYFGSKQNFFCSSVVSVYCVYVIKVFCRHLLNFI